ncbi:MAG: HIT family protein [Pseudomonadota bacterium]
MGVLSIEEGAEKRLMEDDEILDLEEDCLFCRMVMGKEEYLKLYEDETTFAIVDIAQIVKNNGDFILGRSLIMPKRHIAHYYELEDEEAGHLFMVATRVARKIKKAFNPEFVSVFIRGQQVAHAHIILQPSVGYGEDPTDDLFMGMRDFFKIAPKESLLEIARKINEA